MGNKNMKQKFLNFTVTKIIIGIIGVGGIAAAGQLLSNELLNHTRIEKDFKNLIIGIIVSILSVITYCGLFRLYEKRKITEFSKIGIVRNILLGITLGAGLQVLTILIIYLNNGYSIISVHCCPR
ncbi:hypothetical protein JW948_01950 [bacterium]|nr:hypothetical protein [bacterium]